MRQMRVVQQSKSHGCLAGLIAILIISLVICWLASLSQNMVTDVYGAILCAVIVIPLVFAFLKLARPKVVQQGNISVNSHALSQPITPKLSTPNPYEINPYEINLDTYNQIAPYGYYVQAQPINDKVHIPIASPKLIIDKKYIPTALRRAVLERDNYTCQRCNSRSFLELDHIIPRSKGGATTYENLQVLCHGCNMQKGNR